MGLPGSSVPVKTATLYAIDGAEMELQKLESEVIERRHRLELNLKELRKICLELGEDEGTHAASVHPSLGDSRSSSAGPCCCIGCVLASQKNKEAEHENCLTRIPRKDERLLQQVQFIRSVQCRDAQSSHQDLSDRTFDGLRAKILELQECAVCTLESILDPQGIQLPNLEQFILFTVT